MFDIGWSELLVVLVVALVVVGPKDLPKLMRTAGRWAGRARAMAGQFRSSFDDMARQTELEDLRAEMHRLRADRPLSDLDYKTLGIPARPLSGDAPIVNIEQEILARESEPPPGVFTGAEAPTLPPPASEAVTEAPPEPALPSPQRTEP